MTREEAERVAKIIATADGGCTVCVRDLVEKLNSAGLGWEFRFDEDGRREEQVSVSPPGGS